MFKPNTDLGQTLKLKLSGVHSDLGQTNGQPKLSGRRGVGKSYLGGVGPTGLVTKHHQSGGVEVVTG